MKVKKFIGGAIVAAAALAAMSAHAGQVFTVNPTGTDAAYTNLLGSFQSDYIAGNYAEVVTLTPTSASSGTFAYSLFWRGTEFDLNGQAVVSGIDNPAPSTGLGNTYALYATLMGAGTYSSTGTGSNTTVNFSPATGASLELFSARAVGAVAPTNGSSAFTLTTSGTVHKLMTATVSTASGSLKPCQNSDCGSFGVTAPGVTLTNPAGEAFFTGPRPFFEISFEAGNFKDYWLGAAGLPTDPQSFVLGGGAQITFGRIPEPSALALVGLALFGAGLAGRRRA